MTRQPARALILLAPLLVAACANSPARVSRLSADELVAVDEYTLCKAATPRPLYDPSPAVRAEVRRRQLSCGGIYTYQPFPTDSVIPPAAPVVVAPVVVPRSVTCTTAYGTTTCY